MYEKRNRLVISINSDGRTLKTAIFLSVKKVYVNIYLLIFYNYLANCLDVSPGWYPKIE